MIIIWGNGERVTVPLVKKQQEQRNYFRSYIMNYYILSQKYKIELLKAIDRMKIVVVATTYQPQNLQYLYKS